MNVIAMMNVAKSVRELSKDRTKIGCIALDDRDRIVGAGVNGYPAGYDDNDLDNKYSKVVHAEVNAVLNSRCRPQEIETVFIYGLPPCKNCMTFLAASGVKNVYFAIDYELESAPMWYAEHEENKSFHPFITFQKVEI